MYFVNSTYLQSVNIVCTPPPFLQGGGGGGIEPTTKFSKRGGLTEPQLLEGFAGNKGVTFSGGCNFHIKSKSKSEIFNDKKSL